MNAAFFPSAREYSRRYGLDDRRFARLPEHAIVMHPGPMNRGMEISANVADSSRSVIVEQVTNGVAVRMAVLYLLLSGSDPEADPPTGRGGVGMTSYLLTGARPLGGEPTDLLLVDGRIADAADAPADAVQIDAAGLVALPGLVDLHTHLREPGREDAETVESGSRAAARGGYTAVHAMANTDPVADTAGVVEQVWHLGHAAGYCDVRPVGAVTVGLRGERLAELGAMADSAARVRVFSDDGVCVSDAVLMRRALEYVKAFDGVDRPARAGAAAHRGRPDERERDVRRARHARLAGRRRRGDHRARLPARGPRRLRLHVCHVSTAGSVELIRWAKSKGWNVTAEVTPHHLLLTDELVATYDPIYKVNPPLRTADDVEALRAGLADGTIDCVATDHAPHPTEDKECEWAAAAMGMLGLETALERRPAGDGRDRPARLGRGRRPDVGASRADRPGRRRTAQPLDVGAPANVVLVDPAATRTIDPRDTGVAVAQHAVRGASSCPARSSRPSCEDGRRSSTGSSSDRRA